MMSSNVSSVVSCVECQRRKQKCNRQFPCNHCLKRGVSHLCRFASKNAGQKSSKDENSSHGQPRTSKKRLLDSTGPCAPSDGVPDDDDEPSPIDVSDALNGLGYMSHHHHLVLGLNGPREIEDGAEEGELDQSEELKAALLVVPDKPYTDCLVDNWLNGANHHYYALYPPEFRSQYDGWWATPRNKVTPVLTSLILRVCACSLQYIIDDSVRLRLESELKTDVVTLANRLHSAAERLGASIPPGKGGLAHVQQLFLTVSWLKSAEKWTEAWHALSKAIRAANEIGLHQDSLSEAMSEYDREMRRRMWGILYMWDFALGSMLSRPLLVNHADCTIQMPTLVLEKNPERPDQPSPFRHINLHCQLCLDMLAQLGGRSDSEADKAEVAWRLRVVAEKWFESLPAEYAVRAPDVRWDGEFDWVVFQRRYLHLIGFMSLFSQLRPFLTRSSARPMSSLESGLRAAGVQAALDLMDVSWTFFENMASVGAKFHYAVFCIFDTATTMCSALLHDEARNLPQREAVVESIKKGLAMLRELHSESKTTAALYRILKGLLARLPLSGREQRTMGVSKRAKVAATDSPAKTSRAGGQHGIATSGDDFSAPVPERPLPSSDSHAPGPFLLEYPVTMDNLTTVSGTLPLAAPEGFVQAPADFQYAISAPDLGETLAFNQTEWQPCLVPVGDLGNASAFLGGNLAGPDGETPALLAYWDWQGLGLGHPVSWGQSFGQPNNSQGYEGGLEDQ